MGFKPTRPYDGTGRTTVEMQRAATFLAAGWDFVGEMKNGAQDIWQIDEGKDYPRLIWEQEAFTLVSASRQRGWFCHAVAMEFIRSTANSCETVSRIRGAEPLRSS